MFRVNQAVILVTDNLKPTFLTIISQLNNVKWYFHLRFMNNCDCRFETF